MFAPETPLQRAAARNDVTEIEALVKRGVDVNQEGAHGIVAIASAARNGAVDAIR